VILDRFTLTLLLPNVSISEQVGANLSACGQLTLEHGFSSLTSRLLRVVLHFLV